jgi:hypothetical protein
MWKHRLDAGHRPPPDHWPESLSDPCVTSAGLPKGSKGYQALSSATFPVRHDAVVRPLNHEFMAMPNGHKTSLYEFARRSVGETGLEPATPGPPDPYSFDGAQLSSESSY